jgi:type IV secretory pathway VirB4 component
VRRADAEPRRIPEEELHSLADFLPWAALVAPGVVLNKDGIVPADRPVSRSRSRQRDAGRTGRHDRAPEQCAAPSRLRLGDLRRGAASIPPPTIRTACFRNPASALLDIERREQFEDSGVLFESSYFLTFVWLPPAEEASRMEAWLYEGRERSGVDPWELLKSFVDRTDRVLQSRRRLRAGSRLAR